MARTDFPREWQDWVAHNMQRGCSSTDIFNTLLREGFAPEIAERALNIRRVALKRFPSQRIELYTPEGFLQPQECEELIQIIKDNLRPRREPTRDWRRSAATALYETPWTRRGTDVLLGRQRPPGARQSSGASA